MQKVNLFRALSGYSGRDRAGKTAQEVVAFEKNRVDQSSESKLARSWQRRLARHIAVRDFSTLLRYARNDKTLCRQVLTGAAASAPLFLSCRAESRHLLLLDSGDVTETKGFARCPHVDRWRRAHGH